MTDRFVCPKCGIAFVIGKKRGESTMCSAPGCRVRFWHALPARGKDPALVGITPEDAASLKTTGEIPELREITA